MCVDVVYVPSKRAGSVERKWFINQTIFSYSEMVIFIALVV